MGKRKILALVAVLCVALSAWGEIELGMGIAPPVGEVPREASSGGFFGDATKFVHAGYSFLWLFYASYDGFVLPPYSVSSMTGSIDNMTGTFTPGYYRPGFMNTFNVGVRPRIGPISVMASLGINQLYVYKQDEDGLDIPPLGVNMKLGFGFRLAKWIGLTATGMAVFSDPDQLASTLEALGGDDAFLRDQAMNQLLENLYPAIGLYIYL